VDQPVASLAEAGIRLGRNQLLAALLSELAVVLDTFNREGFAAFRDDWMRCSSHENAPVRLSFSHAEPVDGIARGVAENGALQVETAEGCVFFMLVKSACGAGHETAAGCRQQPAQMGRA
jgi:BirA family biotin operon repressor/biotin-[acetyl-CoA-carboxylase] ligase